MRNCVFFYKMKRMGVEWYKFFGVFKFEEGEEIVLKRVSMTSEKIGATVRLKGGK